VGTLGNIYTHHDHRGRGHASAVTSAIVQRLLGRGIRFVALNVKSGNQPAHRVYERLGFRFHTRFLEGQAEGESVTGRR
jgi:ribosomal-protein-alanine N-acetyltransferase